MHLIPNPIHTDFLLLVRRKPVGWVERQRTPTSTQIPTVKYLSRSGLKAAPYKLTIFINVAG